MNDANLLKNRVLTHTHFLSCHLVPCAVCDAVLCAPISHILISLLYHALWLLFGNVCRQWVVAKNRTPMCSNTRWMTTMMMIASRLCMFFMCCFLLVCLCFLFNFLVWCIWYVFIVELLDFNYEIFPLCVRERAVSHTHKSEKKGRCMGDRSQNWFSCLYSNDWQHTKQYIHLLLECYFTLITLTFITLDLSLSPSRFFLKCNFHCCDIFNSNRILSFAIYTHSHTYCWLVDFIQIQIIRLYAKNEWINWMQFIIAQPTDDNKNYFSSYKFILSLLRSTQANLCKFCK